MEPNSIVDTVISHPSVAIVLALIAILQSYRASRYAKLVAESEGAFNRPQLAIGLMGRFDTRQFILLAPLKPSPLLFLVSLNVRNNGSATASEVRLIIRGNKDLLPYTQEWLAKNQDPSGVAVATLQESDGHVNQIMYRIPTLHPGMPINMVHTAALRGPTQISDSVSFRAADGVHVTLPYRVDFGFRLDVALFQESGPNAESFRLTIIDASNRSTQEALKEYWDNRAPYLLKNQPTRNRRFWNWRRSPLEKVCVITVDEAQLSPSALVKGFREVPRQALMGTEGVEYYGGLFVPGLGVGLGSYEKYSKSLGN